MAGTRKKIEIAYICDENYAMATLISLRSLRKNKAENVHYLVHIILAGMEQGRKWRQMFQKEAVENGFCIEIHESKVEHDEIFFQHSYVSKAALVKFQLPEILKDTAEVLYLDSDTLIRPGLEGICGTEIDNYYAAVVKDMTASMGKHMRELGLNAYFNSGVMYMNLQKMRKDGMEKALLHWKMKEKQHVFMDQDAFNAVFGSGVIFVHPKYNLIYDIFRKYTSDEFASFYEINQSAAAALHKTAAVLHMAGARKPWKEQESEQLVEWLSYIESFEEFAVCEKAYYNKQLAADTELQREIHERKSGQHALEQKAAEMMEQIDVNYRQVQQELQQKILKAEEEDAIYRKGLEIKIAELEIKIAELETRMAVYENTFFRRVCGRLTRRKNNL